MQPGIDTNLGISGEPDGWMHSACVLCSNGCGLDIAVKDGRIVGVRGSANHPVNFGHLGPKGEHGWIANNTKRRGTMPMVRRRKSEPLRPVSWPEAMDFFIDRFKEAWKQGHDNLACYNSGQLTIEELYTTIAVSIGTAMDRWITAHLRKASITRLPTIDQTILYYESGKARVLVLYDPALVAYRLKEGAGVVIVPKPAVTAVAGAGIRREADKTWRDYLTTVLAYYYENGTTGQLYRDYLAKRGLNAGRIPGITKESLERG